MVRGLDGQRQKVRSRTFSGIAKAIRERWPEVYTRYRIKYECEVDLLGQIQPVIINANKAVMSLFYLR